MLEASLTLFLQKIPDISDENPFCLMLPNNDLPFDFELVIDFAKRMNKIVDHPKQMRNYADTRLNWQIKMKKLVEFFDFIYKDKYQN